MRCQVQEGENLTPQANLIEIENTFRSLPFCGAGVVLLGWFPQKKLFAGREKTDDVWIGGGGSWGSGEYDCAHQTALYNTRN